MRRTVCLKRFPPSTKFKYSEARSGNASAHESLLKSRKLLTNAGNRDVELSPFGSNYKSNESSNALQLFDELSKCDVVSATSLLGRLAKCNLHKDCIFLFSRMLELDIRPNEFTFGTVVHSSVLLEELNLGKQLHACALKIGLGSNVFVGSTIIDFYVKISTVQEAQKVFEETKNPNVVSYTTLISGYLREERLNEAMELFKRIPQRNVVSWNAMVSGCSQTGNNEEAVHLFVQMLREGVVPSHSTFPCAIIAAANIAALGMGRCFHASALKFLGDLGLFIGNSLISFYAKCGSMEDSLLAFCNLHEKNVVSWNAVICGYAQNGKGKEAVEMFQKMKYSGIKPNSVTLLGLLLACNHVGLVDEGCSFFNHARLEDSSMLGPEHYACVVDLLSRSGRFQEAEKLIAELPFDPGIGFWKAVLGGCQIHSNMELGEFAARKILALDPGDVSSYIMLSNAHSAAGRWQSVSAIRHEIRDKGLKRVPGCSWIEIKSRIHVFVTGDRRHIQKLEIYEVLTFFLQHMVQSQDADTITEC
ncbi:hypothetical protein M9H77_17082 [Catharanthus roseus]|uniref:Uncharacterized protein n=1 Tax=Catharanthus roseus TaxID=4058 RepID=A0ACC0B3L5_CATRO|nr:hypothetical protein M9H77_17082 [Catharanthus roseus]